uniref:Uncharacterized protein n=1 Tax=Meloidogyne enterolobii TaxID=390850 RepID=A0A6V7U1H7_MELEN|nr:unnamed protein product [Meloidogyne enterolobii]
MQILLIRRFMVLAAFEKSGPSGGAAIATIFYKKWETYRHNVNSNVRFTNIAQFVFLDKLCNKNNLLIKIDKNT